MLYLSLKNVLCVLRILEKIWNEAETQMSRDSELVKGPCRTQGLCDAVSTEAEGTDVCADVWRLLHAEDTARGVLLVCFIWKGYLEGRLLVCALELEYKGSCFQQCPSWTQTHSQGKLFCGAHTHGLPQLTRLRDWALQVISSSSLQPSPMRLLLLPCSLPEAVWLG